MLIQFLVGGIVSVCNITIHALVMTVVVRVARASGTKKRSRPSLRLTHTRSSLIQVNRVARLLGPITAMNGNANVWVVDGCHF
jgi:hypothetical protein